MAQDSRESSGQEGLHYLCSKYSSLITRLRQEVLARQKAEAEARLLERRLRESRCAAENEAQAAVGLERVHWEAERRLLHNEVAALRASQRDACDLRGTEAEELRRSTATSARLSERCDRLHEAVSEEAQKTLQVLDQATAGGEVLIRQGEELTRLRREHAELLSQHHDVYDELTSCRENLARWRRTGSDLEGKLEAAMSARDEAEGRARQLQEEMRQALRSASTARQREVAATSCAGRGVRELRSREARLAAVRREGQRCAQRATSAERRLRMVESYEVAAERLGLEGRELRARLDAEARACEGARVELARVEASEARAAAGAGEAQSELRAKEALAAASRQRVAELEGELARARARLEQVETDRTSCGGTIDGLRDELRTAREEREEARRERDRTAQELAESRRRLDRGTPQLAECRRKLGSAEEAATRAGAEVAEERRARQRCHAEAVRVGEKLRASRSHCSQLRERVRSFEELELRYPSRFRADTLGDCAELDLVDELDAGLAAAPPRWALPHEKLPSKTPLSGGSVGLCGAAAVGTVGSVREFVALEEERLGSSILAAGGRVGDSGMWEEPRTTTPAQQCLDFPRHGGGCESTSPGGGGRPVPLVPGIALAGAAADVELAALLAAEPRVLKLPESLQISGSPAAELQVGDGRKAAPCSVSWPAPLPAPHPGAVACGG